MSLTGDQQRFLLNGYKASAAEALAGGRWLESLRRSSRGFYGDRMQYETSARGVSYVWEPRSDQPSELRWVTWSQIAAHRATLPESLLQRLIDCLDAGVAEAIRHNDAMDQINKNWYRGATPAECAKLDAESEAHWLAEAELRAELAGILAECLPLGDGEPTDLIEWAEVTAG